MKIAEVQNDLANKLLEYEKEINYYEYHDNYSNDEDAYKDILDSLRNNYEVEQILFILKEDLNTYEKFYKEEPNNEQIKYMFSKTKSIFDDVKKYQKSMNEMEYGR